MSGHRARPSPVRPGGGRLAARLLAAALVLSLGGGCVAGGRAPATEDTSGAADALADGFAAESGAPDDNPETMRNPANPLAGVTYAPVVDPGDFVRVVDNPYFPLTPGLTLIYESKRERVEVTVTFETRAILGVTTIVVIDRSFVGRALVEEAEEWFAQDRWGNVWYFGEEALEVNDGVMERAAGSWQAGVDGAQPGIVMLGEPRAGDLYRQEFLRGAAEDMARVVSVGHRVEVPYGAFSEALMVEDWTPLEPDVVEGKLYAPGIGLVSGRSLLGGDDSLHLVEVRSS